MYKAKIADTEAQVAAAYELFYRCFGPTYYEAKENFNITRQYDPTLTMDNLFVVEDEEKSVVATLRSVVRELTINGEKFPTGGIATTAVAPEHRGKGLFTLLTKVALDEMVKRELSLCLVFARRAIDHIYVPHGFWGAPVERKYTLLVPPTIGADTLSFRKMEIDDIPFLEETHRQVNRYLPVYLDRPAPLWKMKLMHSAFDTQFAAYICNLNITKEPIGYIVARRGRDITDIGCRGTNTEIYQSMLFASNSPVRDTSLLGMNLSTEHPAIKAFNGHAYSIFTRHRRVGGHVLKILDPYNRNSKIMKLVHSQLAIRGAKISNVANTPPEILSRVLIAALFGYEVPETRNVLELREDSLWSTLRPLDFVFSPLDEF